ncbi:hypothetical protein HPP92_006785 [Vanilla planifolia]|uniref:Cytochrome b-c1 complex subunit Rieske transmembrane domain-containing protein n=1 Tax=Vanilla planifolia TaxID=51239 RepID=A0A835V906_VANPL|nr:hypothetical protein HPP92_006785 [Vanilla planifolia]
MLRIAGKRVTLLSWRPACAGSSLLSRAPIDDGSPLNHRSTSIVNSPDARFALESGFLAWVRAFSSESLLPRHHELGLADLPATVAAAKNASSKIVYDHHNHERYAPGDPSKRAFAYFVLTGGRFVYASLLRVFILKFVLSMSASKDVLALASLEVDLSSIEPGSTVTVKWRGKPVFIKHRTEDDIQLANAVDMATLRDPQEDSVRVKNPQWLVLLVSALIWVAYLCQMLEILVGGFARHGSHYDGSGRIRKGPAPFNLEVPHYTFLEENKLLIG